ncbi:MAG: FAD-dependent oxidoreductase [Fibrobacteria bacterium]|nr:FAD-dependent oxidoreductase [Fibrobacteria bacterium]
MRKVIVVGGVAGGASAAARLRRLDESAEIILVERGEHVSYANCGLPYYAGGVIEDREKLFLMTPETFRRTLNIEVRVGTEAIAIDVANKKVSLLDRKTGIVREESCDALVLSPGAEPVRPPIPGVDHPRILTLRSVPDIDRIKEVVEIHRPERAVVVGAGFIGLEMAENLWEKGIATTVVEALDQVMNVVDFEMAAPVHHHLREKGVGLHLADGVKEFVARGSDRVQVDLRSGVGLSADLVILSIGVKPDTRLAREAGIRLDQRGYIEVGDDLRTSVPWIFAAGDAIVARSPLTGRPLPVPLAGPANKQARIIAENIVRERPRTWGGSIATAVAKVFDLTVAATGLSEKTCKREGIAYRTAIVHPGSHAGYYPGSHPYALKLLWDPASGRILGAQGVGREGVDKRIDVVAAHLGMRATVEDLARFEHAYAPPFASAKDGTNYAAFVAVNEREGLTDLVRWDEVERRVAAGAFLLDVRTPEEFELGHIPGAVNIPNTALRTRLSEVPRDRELLLYCGVGIRGYLAERILRENGYTRLGNLTGGWKTWKAATDPQDNRGEFRPAVRRPESSVEEAGYAEGSGAPEGLSAAPVAEIRIDACGLQCPGPILKLKQAVDQSSLHGRVVIQASDPGFARDAQSWCNITGHHLVGVREEKGTWTATVEKRPGRQSDRMEPKHGVVSRVSGDEATFIVFSNDLDRALAAFVIANGALATGKKVTMFFTFWGLSIIRRRGRSPRGKDLMGRMFDALLPRHADGLALSRMNFAGVGAALMKRRMESMQIDHLETMIENAVRGGVRITACQMSMDLMGVSREELIDGVEIGGVAAYMEAAGTAGINLFV